MIDYKNISIYQKDLGLLTQTANQIIKDFDCFGFEILFSGYKETAYSELHNQIQPIIETLLTHQYKKLFSLLYRIDLNEIQISHATKINPEKNITDIITELIIKRELQKVVIRNSFKL